MDQLEETKRGQDETLQEVIRQLKAQQLQDTARIKKVSQESSVSILVTIFLGGWPSKPHNPDY